MASAPRLTVSTEGSGSMHSRRLGDSALVISQGNADQIFGIQTLIKHSGGSLLDGPSICNGVGFHMIFYQTQYILDEIDFIGDAAQKGSTRGSPLVSCRQAWITPFFSMQIAFPKSWVSTDSINQ